MWGATAYLPALPFILVRDFSPRNAAAVVGVAYATQLVVRKAWQLVSGFRAYFLAPRGLAGVDLKRYGPWAGQHAARLGWN